MECKEISKSLFIPSIGFGTADLTGNAEEIIYNAILAGHRFIDTAAVYGTEGEVGKAVKRAIADGIVKREDLFIETKIAPGIHGKENVASAFMESLEKMQLDYVDMYLIHWPVARGSENSYRYENVETWEVFQMLKKQKYIKHTGVCNFLERHLLHFIEAGMEMPEVNQLEIHPGFQQRGLVEFCVERGIGIEAWSPMGRGILRTSKFEEMAQKYGKDVNQLALNWSIRKGFIPITRSSNKQHIISNLNVFDFKISSEDMMEIDNQNTCDNHQDIWAYKRQKMY